MVDKFKNKFVTICRASYSNSSIPIVKGDEYIVVPARTYGGHHIYTLDKKWITVFSREFGTYFYTKDELDKIRDIRLDKLLK